MRKTVDFYFDFSSTYSYFGQHRMIQLSAQYDVDIHWKPIVLGAIFKSTGHSPPFEDSPRKRYTWKDVERCAAELNLPYQWPDPFPFNGITASRIYYLLHRQYGPELAVDWARAVFDGSFGKGLDAADPEVLVEIADSLGLDGNDLLQDCQQDDIKNRLKAVTAEAAERDVFGAPTFFLDGEMFWGADRIYRLERRLAEAG